MKKLVCCIVIFLQSFFCFSQPNPKLDSLKNVLAKLPAEGKSFESDTMRVRVLCEMATLNSIGNENKSIDEVKHGLELSENQGWEKGIGITNHLLGYLYASKNEDIRAIEYYFKSLLITEKTKDEILTAKTCRFLGDSYSRLGSFAKAKEFINKSLTIYQNNNLEKSYINTLNSMGMVLQDEKEHEKAIIYFKKCIQLSAIKNLSSRKHSLSNIGISYLELGKYDSAMVYLVKSIDVKLENKDLNSFSDIICIIHQSKISNLQKQPQKAIQYLKNADNLNLTYGNEITSKLINQQYYEAYKQLENTKKALDYYEKYIKLNSNLSEQDFKTKIKNLQFEYEFSNEKNQNVILQLNLKQEKLIKNSFGLGILFLVFLGGFLWWNNRLLSSKNRKIEDQKTEITTINSKLEYLNKNLEIKVDERTFELTKANEELLKKNEEILSALVEGQTLERKRVGVELHDNLGAMLSGMKWRLQALNKDKLPEKEQKIYEGILSMMGEAYSEVRLISHNLLPAELEKSGLKGALRKLTNDINLSGKLQINLDFDEKRIKIDKKTELELYGISMELVNNILKHAQASQASISIFKENDTLNLSISDNGKGISDDIQANGMGMKNIRKRIEGLNGTINFKPLRQGLMANVKVPLSVNLGSENR